MSIRKSKGGDEPPRIETTAYVLNGIVFYPDYTKADHYAMPGMRTITGERLRALGAAEIPREMWKFPGRRKR